MNIAIFASGNGSNFQALVDDAFIKPHVKLLVCDKPNAYVLERANTHQIPVFLFEAKNYPDKEAFETEILLELRGLEIDLLVLAGYAFDWADFISRISRANCQPAPIVVT